MTLSANWELQKAVHAALLADASLSTLVADRIHDRPPADVTFPFVTLGDTEIVPDGAGSDGAAIHRLSFSVWSQNKGRREAKEIMCALDAVLQDADLSLAGHVIVNLQLEGASVVYASEAEAVRGRLTFRVYTEPTT